MANQFDKPVSNKYVSQYVKAPVQALKTAGARYQKRSDKNRKKALLLRKSMDQDALAEHQPAVDERIQKHEEDLNQITEDGDYLNAGSRINDKVIEFKQDEVLNAAKEAKKQKQAIVKNIDKDLSNAPKFYRDHQKGKIQVGDLQADENGNVEAEVGGPSYPKYLTPSERQDYLNKELKRFKETYNGPGSEELSGVVSFEGLQNYLQQADVSSITENRIKKGLASSLSQEYLNFAQEYANANPLQNLSQDTINKVKNGELSVEEVRQNPQKHVRNETQIWETNSKGEPIYRNKKGERVSSKNKNAIIQVNENTMWGGLISAKTTQGAHTSVDRSLKDIDGNGDPGGPGGPGGDDGEIPMVLTRPGHARSLNKNNYDEARKRYQELDTIISDQKELLDEMKKNNKKGSPAYLKQKDKLNNLKRQHFNYKQRLEKVNQYVDPDEAFKKAGYDEVDVDNQNSYGTGDPSTGNYSRISEVEARNRIKEGLKKNKNFHQIFPKGVDQLYNASNDALYLMYESVKEQYDKQVESAFDNNDISRQPTVLYGNPDGKGSSKVGQINELNSTEAGINDRWSMAYSNQKSAKQKLKEELGSPGNTVDLGEDYNNVDGEILKKKSVKLTEDVNEQGHPVYEMTSYARIGSGDDAEEVPVQTMYVTKGEAGMAEYRMAAKEFANGNKDQRDVSVQMTANMKYMPALKQAGIQQMEKGQKRMLNLKSEDSNQNLYVEKTDQGDIRIYDEDKDDYTPTVGGIDQAARMLHNVEWNIKKHRRGQNQNKSEQSQEEMEENSKEDLEEDQQKPLPDNIKETTDPVTGESTNPEKVIRTGDGLYNFTSYAADTEWGQKVKRKLNSIGEIKGPEEINQKINSYENSVLKGKAGMITSVANQYNIDRKVLLAILDHESLMGTSNIARENNNFGGITWNSNYSKDQKGSPRPNDEGGHYVQFETVRAGLKAQAELISERKMDEEVFNNLS